MRAFMTIGLALALILVSVDVAEACPASHVFNLGTSNENKPEFSDHKTLAQQRGLAVAVYDDHERFIIFAFVLQLPGINFRQIHLHTFNQ